MKRSAIHSPPYSLSHPPRSLPSLINPQPSINPLPYPCMSQCTNDHTSGYVIDRHGPSTSAMSSQPPQKRRRREASAYDNIARREKAPKSHPHGRPGRRGQRNPQTKALRVRQYVDSGGPHCATMVIDSLIRKYHLTHPPFCWLNFLYQKSYTLLTTRMSALASHAITSWSKKLSGLNFPTRLSQKTSLPFPQLPTRF